MRRIAPRLLLPIALLPLACRGGSVPPEAVTSNVLGAPGAAVPLAGFQPFDTRARQTWDARRTATAYPRPEGAEGPRVYFEEAAVVPGFATPGSALMMLMQYAVLDAGEGVELTEIRQVLRGGEVAAEISRETVSRADGTFICTQQCLLPYGMPRGEYAVRQIVEREGVAVFSRDTVFTLGSR